VGSWSIRRDVGAFAETSEPSPRRWSVRREVGAFVDTETLSVRGGAWGAGRELAIGGGR
jgi:hypothetical protein